MYARSLYTLSTLVFVASGAAFAATLTTVPNAQHGQELAARLCSNCHLVGNAEQQQANADVPSFHEIANKEGQSAGAIMAHIMLPSTRCRQFLSRRASLPTSPPTFSAFDRRSKKLEAVVPLVNHHPVRGRAGFECRSADWGPWSGGRLRSAGLCKVPCNRPNGNVARAHSTAV